MSRREVAFAGLLALGAVASSIGLATHTRPISDEGAVLTAAARILRGEVFFRDVDAYWFPGSAYLLAFAMDLLGEHLSVARALAAGSYVLLVLALYALALQLLSTRRAVLFGVGLLCLKIVAWPALTAYFYWDLAFCAACLATLLFSSEQAQHRAPRLLAAGALAAAAFCFKQNVGVYLAAAGTAILLVRAPAGARLRSASPFALGFAIVLVPILAAFAAQGLLGELLWASFARPFESYVATSGVSFWEPLAWWKLGDLRGVTGSASTYSVMPVHLLGRAGAFGDARDVAYAIGEIYVRLVYTSVPLALLGTLLLAWRRARSPDERARSLLRFAILAGAVAASALPRADFTHLVSVYPLLFLLLLGLWQRAVDRADGSTPSGIRILEVGIAVVFVALSIALAAVHQAQRTQRVDLPRARVWVPPEHAYLETLVRGIDAELAPDEHLFVYGQEAHLYFLTDRYYPWRFTQLYPGQAGGDGGAALAERLREQPPALVVHGFTRRLAELPALSRYAPRLAAAVRAGFETDRGFFARHPPPPGVPLPPPRELRILRPRRHP